MYDPYLLMILLILHFSLALCLLLNPRARLRHRKEYIIPVLLVPLFGPFLAATIEILFLLDNPGNVQVDVESLKLRHDIFSLPVKQVDENEARDVVPLEEAILIDNVEERRNALLKTFQDNSSKYLNVLMLARNIEDVDTAHYATIQLVKFQRQFQLKLQEYAARFVDDPENEELLDEYIDYLDYFLQSPLAEKGLLYRQRQVFADLLERKLELVKDDRQALIRKLRNATAQKENYTLVREIIATLKDKWPLEEQTWIEVFRATVEWDDQTRLREAVAEMKSQAISWTKHNQELIQPWVNR